MSHYKITSSLSTSGPEYNEIEFLGCDAEVTGETTSCYFVKFYEGLPFLIGKNTFLSASTPQAEPQHNKNMITADVTLWSGQSRIKTFRTLLLPDDHEYLSVKKNAKMWFKLSEGTHYDRITHEVINQISQFKTNTEMPRTKATTTETTANTVTGVVLFEDQAKKVNLPAIPKVMTIGGVEFSEAAIKKEVDSVKKITLEIIMPTDTVEVAEAKRKVYEELDTKRKAFVKTRTVPTKFYDEVSKPTRQWNDALRAQTKAYGNLAEEGELHCKQQIEIWDNHEAEQARIEEERVQKIVDSRTADLQSVAGILNRDSLHWTFEHAPSKLVENTFLQEADDSEWNGLMAELEASVKAKKDKEAQKEAEFESAKNAVFNTRIQMLQLVGGYETPNPGLYTKNGHSLTDEQIRTTPDADWMNLILSHNKPKDIVNPFEISPQATNKDPEPIQSSFSGNTISGSGFNPFKQFAQATESEVGVSADQTISGVAAQEESFLPHTIWDQDYVEKVLGKTTLRIFPTEHKSAALKGIGEIGYDGKWDNGLMFVIYKNAQ